MRRRPRHCNVKATELQSRENISEPGKLPEEVFYP